jgi:hypothetical protein
MKRCDLCVRHAHDGRQVARNPGHVNKRNGGGAGIFLLATGVMVFLRVVRCGWAVGERRLPRKAAARWALVVVGLLFVGGAGAQERTAKAVAAARTRVAVSGAPRPMAYAASRESVVQGTVIQYEEVASAAPLGAHAKVQTASGTVDVHLGPASYLKARRFSLAAGDAVRFVGATSTGKTGSVFLARTVERGGEKLALRSPRGALAANGGARAQAARDGAQSLQHGGAR